jgi:hypothetical protein
MFSQFWWGWAFGILCTVIGGAIVIGSSVLRCRYDKYHREEVDQWWNDTHG